jgi:mRNA interferase MazF
MTKGDIVLIPFPFTDLSGSKNRPAVVLFENELDVTVAFISSVTKWQIETDLFLTPNYGNGLKRDSIIRTNKIATLDKGLLLGKLGGLAKEEIELLDKKLIALLGLKI